MSGWRERVETLLYDGETIEESVQFDTSTVVVTSHRLLAFTPERDGANFQQVERLNVDGVETGARSEGNLLERGLRYGIIGAILVVAGQFINLDGLLGSVSLTGQSTSELGLGGIMGTLQAMLNLLTQLDRLLQLFGALAILLAVVLLTVYWYTRESTVVIGVAGDDDIHIPRPTNMDDSIERLRRALDSSLLSDDEIPSDPLQES